MDDEPIARKILREELESIDDVVVVGEADNGAMALTKIAEHRPKLVLLDLQMPPMGGLDVVRQLKHGTHIPVIVMVTAYDQYALQAFNAGAIDYLLKPVGQERLAEAVQRAKRVTRDEAADRLAKLQELTESASSRPQKVVGKVGDEYFLLNGDEIYAFQADGDLVWIIAGKKRYLATQTLKVLELRLQRSRFLRIHRNALVNIDQVRKMRALSSQRWLLTLTNDQEFVVSKRQSRCVREFMNW